MRWHQNWVYQNRTVRVYFIFFFFAFWTRLPREITPNRKKFVPGPCVFMPFCSNRLWFVFVFSCFYACRQGFGASRGALESRRPSACPATSQNEQLQVGRMLSNFFFSWEGMVLMFLLLLFRVFRLCSLPMFGRCDSIVYPAPCTLCVFYLVPCTFVVTTAGVASGKSRKV